MTRSRLLSTFLMIIVSACNLICSGCAGTSAEGPGWDEARQDADLRILALCAREDYAAVLALTDSLVMAGRNDPRLKGQRALALGMTGKVAEATAIFEESLLEDYASCENHLNFAVMLMKAGKTGRALTEFKEARRFCGEANEPMILRNLAVGQLKMGRTKVASDLVDEGLSLSSGDPYLLGLKAMLVADSEPAKAESLFVKSERAGGMTGDFLYQLGLLFLRTGRPSSAVRSLDAVLDERPHDLEVNLNYAEALIRSGRWDEASMALSEMRKWTDDTGVTGKLARVRFRQEKYAEALSLFRELPEKPETRDRVAMCLHNMGRSAEAIEIQRKVVAERPDWTVGLVNYSAMLGALGELKEAEKILIRVLQLDPGNATARVNLDILRKALK
ncbi:MAG: tetratricopeptide repeat protein [Candidatus Krumholzibacteria bacterium]|nr:tetratricopeptide repeat protein [Candidatus Krumholzibacteria bacterium]